VDVNERYLSLVREKAKRKILFVPHALRQMSRADRMITVSDVRKVIFEGEIIEDYPRDKRGHSCLMLGTGMDGRAIHVVCSPKDEYLVIITAYLPTEHEWEQDFRVRRKN